MDLRYSTLPLSALAACDAPPQSGILASAPAARIARPAPVELRAGGCARTAAMRTAMPQWRSNLVDSAGVALPSSGSRVSPRVQ